MKYFFGNEESAPIIVGSLVNLKSNPNIFGTVLERMIETNEVKYRLQLNGRMLTFPESMIELLKPKMDEKILAALEADFSSPPQIGNDTIDSIINSPPLPDVQNEELNTIPEVPSIQKHFSFSSAEVNNVDVHSLGSFQEKITYEKKHGDEDEEEEEYELVGEAYNEDVIEEAVVNKKDYLQVLKVLNEKKHSVHENKITPQEEKISDSISIKRVAWSTVIDGKSFKFAFFYSYVGLPIGFLFSFFLFIAASSSMKILAFVYLIQISVQLIIMTGLYKFKYYAYLILMINHIGAMFLNTILLMLLFKFDSISYIVQIITNSIIVYYFYSRGDAYAKNTQ